MSTPEPRLTSLAHGGGCGCKLAPAVLREILAGMPQATVFANLMVGTETSDDAAVWRLNDQQALVATTDFFMPVVDDPFDFGRIAATNALSDVYAMGATPIFALALVGMPVATLSTATIGQILAGGASVCAAAGIPVAGGHSIDSVEPIYGDVTGFGLLGHGLEMARGSGLTVEIEAAAAPLLDGVETLARDGMRTGASGRNWASYGEGVVLPDGFDDWRRDLLTDPQTSGGLLIAVAADQAGAVLDLVRADGFHRAAVVGRMVAGPAVVRVIG